MEHYVTLFDRGFLPQGLALFQSMLRHAGPFRLWVLCMDDECHEALASLAFPQMSLLRLTDVESAELREVSTRRTRREYCWTLTPFTPAFVFNADPQVQRVTYVDADTWFCASPSPLFQELETSGKSVLITHHAFAPEYDQGTKSGRFCVQFVTFVRDAGEPVRSRWAGQCLEWCFSRVEAGRFGDQMYLDEWPSRFPHLVHVLRDKSLTQAPWNSARFPPSEAAIYHFHGLRILRGNHALLGEGYRLYAATIDAFYRPYLRDLGNSIKWLADRGIDVGPQIDRPLPAVWLEARLRSMALWLKRQSWRLFLRIG